jgi:hypothetical protein
MFSCLCFSFSITEIEKLYFFNVVIVVVVVKILIPYTDIKFILINAIFYRHILNFDYCMT